MQRGTPVIVTGSCHLRIEPGGNITVHTPLSCFLLSLPAFTRKHGFPPTKFLHVSQNILPVKKKNCPCKDVFLSSIHTVPVFVCSVNSPLKDVHVIHRRRHFTTVFYFRNLFLLLLLYVSTRLELDLMETVISPVCVCVFLFLSLACSCDSLSDHCIRFSGNLQDSPHAPWT